MTKYVGVQACREAIAEHHVALQNADKAFFSNLEQRFNALKSKSQHPSDFRRLEGEIEAWVNKFINRSDWDTKRDKPAYDGACAWQDLVGIEIQNLVVASNALGISIAGDGQANGWRNAETGAPIRLYAPEDKVHSGARNSVSMGDLLEGMILGAKSPTIQAALESGTDTAGGYTVPREISQDFIDRLRAASVFVQAGARTVPLDGKLRIVRLESDPTAIWRAENTSIGDSDIVLGAIDFVPKTLSTLVKVPFELLQDSVNVADILMKAMVGALSTELDRAALFGAGTATEPLGLFSATNINSVSMGANGATPSNFDNLLDSVYEIELDNAGAPTACIWHPRTALTYRKMKDTTGQVLVAPEPIRDLPKLATTAVPITQTQGTSNNCSTVLLGDFSQAIIGLREDITIARLTETFAANGQVGFWARMRADIGFAHGQSFCKLIGVKP